MDHDDHGLILPPPDRRKIVQTISSSGMPITDCLIEGFDVQSNHPGGGFYGPRMVGENYGQLLRSHPVYIDPVSSLAGGYNVNFGSYRKNPWNPDFDFSFLKPEIERYKLLPGIGAGQHFCQDLQMVWTWLGRLDGKDRRYRPLNGPEKDDFFAGLEATFPGRRTGSRGTQPRHGKWRLTKLIHSCARTWKRWRRSNDCW